MGKFIEVGDLVECTGSFSSFSHRSRRTINIPYRGNYYIVRRIVTSFDGTYLLLEEVTNQVTSCDCPSCKGRADEPMFVITGFEKVEDEPITLELLRAFA